MAAPRVSSAGAAGAAAVAGGASAGAAGGAAPQPQALQPQALPPQGPQPQVPQPAAPQPQARPPTYLQALPVAGQHALQALTPRPLPMPPQPGQSHPRLSSTGPAPAAAGVASVVASPYRAFGVPGAATGYAGPQAFGPVAELPGRQPVGAQHLQSTPQRQQPPPPPQAQQPQAPAQLQAPALLQPHQPPAQAQLQLQPPLQLQLQPQQQVPRPQVLALAPTPLASPLGSVVIAVPGSAQQATVALGGHAAAVPSEVQGRPGSPVAAAAGQLLAMPGTLRSLGACGTAVASSVSPTALPLAPLALAAATAASQPTQSSLAAPAAAAPAAAAARVGSPLGSFTRKVMQQGRPESGPPTPTLAAGPAAVGPAPATLRSLGAASGASAATLAAMASPTVTAAGGGGASAAAVAAAAAAAAAVAVAAAATASLAPPKSEQTPSPPSRDEAEDSDLEWLGWSVEEVGEWVDNLLEVGAGEAFRRHKIDGPTLLGLSEAELREPLGFTDAMQRAKLLGHLRAFQVRRARVVRKAARHSQPGQPHGIHAVTGERPTRGHGAVTPPGPQGPPTATAARVRGSRDLGGAGPGLSRSPSAASSLGSGTFRLLRGGAGGKVREGAVGSCFGHETPSDSTKGTFSQAPRESRGSEAGPGPASYNVLDAERSSTRHTTAPRGTIGTSPRRIAKDATELDVLPEPGPVSYDVAGAEAALRHSPRAMFGSAAREASYSDGETRRSTGPGPGAYMTSNLPSRASSPKGTMGKSARDTTEFVVQTDSAVAAGAAPTPLRCGSVGCLATPRIPGGYIGTTPRLSRTPEPERPEPGPTSYNPGIGRGTHMPSVRIGTARRDTMEFLVRSDSGMRFAPGAAGQPGSQPSSPGARSRSRGGVIGSAPRWPSAAGSGGARGVGGSPSRGGSTSPGPTHYYPRPTCLSTFR